MSNKHTYRRKKTIIEMRESSRNPLFLFFFLFTLINFANKFIAAQNAEYRCNSDLSVCFSYYCSNDGGNYTADSPYQQNLNTVLSSLPITTSTNYGFEKSSAGQGLDGVNYIALCRGDINQDECRSCISDSTTNVTQFCPNQMEALIWYDHCMILYSNRILSGDIINHPTANLLNYTTPTDVPLFMGALTNLTDNLKKGAAGGGPQRKFATGSVVGPASYTIYGLMQCTPDLTQSQCNDCLSNVTREIPSIYGDKQIGCRINWPSCNLRYEIYKFFTEPPAIALPHQGNGGTIKLIASISVSTLMAAVTAIFVL